jgi:hypothetical protein
MEVNRPAEGLPVPGPLKEVSARLKADAALSFPQTESAMYPGW